MGMRFWFWFPVSYYALHSFEWPFIAIGSCLFIKFLILCLRIVIDRRHAHYNKKASSSSMEGLNYKPHQRNLQFNSNYILAIEHQGREEKIDFGLNLVHFIRGKWWIELFFKKIGAVFFFWIITNGHWLPYLFLLLWTPFSR